MYSNSEIILQLVETCQVVTDPCCRLAVIFCGFISHQFGRETMKIPEIFSCDRVFTDLYLAKTFEFLLTDSTFAPRFP